jgi:NTP pyrophosphatase (non-canonical NTP hydrolase)
MKKHQEKVDKAFRENGWQYWSPLSMFARLAEETGEVGRVMNHLFGEKPKKDTEEKEKLGEELGDVIYACICIANSQGIDLDEEIKKSIAKMAKRDMSSLKR